MTVLQLVQKDKGLLKAFKRFQKRYLNMAKRADVRKLIPEVVYRTMRLEGEKITRRKVSMLFKQPTA